MYGVLLLRNWVVAEVGAELDLVVAPCPRVSSPRAGCQWVGFQ